MRHRPTSFGPLAIALIALLIAGCSSDGDETQNQDVQSMVTAAPTDTADASAFDFTSTITITESGFEPRQAVAVLGETLTFVNNTTRDQTIHFTNGVLNVNGSGTIGPIAPGESMSFPDPLTSTASLIYESDGLPGKQGQLQIDPGIDTI